MSSYYQELVLREVSPFFHGYFKVQFSHLNFSSSLFGSKVFDPQNVIKLEKHFSQNQLARLEKRNSISAVISRELLRQALSRVQRPQSPAHDPPSLPLPNGCMLECLYGKHRIKAASPLLYPGDSWWIVSLYDDSKFLP